MKTKIIICLVVGLWACSCASNDSAKDVVVTKHVEKCSCNGCNNASVSFESLSKEELHNTNLRLTRSVRENFRSWKTNDPDRWGYLSQKFADEVIAANPTAKLNQKNIKGIFIKYLEQQAMVAKAETKDKQNLKVKANNEFRFNLTYEIGMVEYNNWQKITLANFAQFKQQQDSLKMLIVEQTQRIKQNKK